jgi:hypothetical protein
MGNDLVDVANSSQHTIEVDAFFRCSGDIFHAIEKEKNLICRRK